MGSDHAGGNGQNLLRFKARGLGHHVLRGPAVVQSLLAGAGIGLTGIGQHSAGRAAGLQNLLAGQDRRGLEQIPGEHAGQHTGSVGNYQAKVVAARLLEIGRRGSGFEPLGKIVNHNIPYSAVPARHDAASRGICESREFHTAAKFPRLLITIL